MTRYKLIFAAGLLVFMAFATGNKKITIWLAGDSTMAQKKKEAYPETGWGMEIGQFFNSDVTIENKAQNGRSTLSFINEKRWEEIKDNVKPGDYVFIEFGHNDEKIDKPGVGTTHDQYRDNLCLFINDVRAKKANPLLLTSTARRSFKNGTIQYTHKGYPEVMKHVADSMEVPIIDMEAMSMKLLASMGEDSSTMLYNYVPAGHPNYPEGKKDDTHFSPQGARQMAILAVEGIKGLHLPLAEYLKH